jgi:hypothetical protein
MAYNNCICVILHTSTLSPHGAFMPSHSPTQFTNPTTHSRHPKGWFYTRQLITLKRQTANSTTTPPQKPQIPLLTIQKHPVLRIEPMNYAKPSTNFCCDVVSKWYRSVSKRYAHVSKHLRNVSKSHACVSKHCDGVSKPHATLSKVYRTVSKSRAHVSKHCAHISERPDDV